MTPVAIQTLRWSVVYPGTTLDFGTDEARARKVFEAARKRAKTNGGDGRLFFGATLVSKFEVP